MKSKPAKRVTAGAPATVANVAVGFDILGFAIENIYDEVSITSTAERGLVIESVQSMPNGPEEKELSAIPRDPAKNAATAGILRLLEEHRLSFGLRLTIRKGIPLGSGMGGSAASAVAGVVAANQFLPQPLPRERLLDYALDGEQAATGSRHADNAAPCLYGGMVLARHGEPPEVVSLSVPAGIRCILVHPHQRIDTREARGILADSISLRDHVRQSANLAAFLTGCFQGNLALIRKSFEDVIIEPQRSRLIPGFDGAKRAAIAAGALGCSISGSGPSVFAWAENQGVAQKIRDALTNAFAAAGVATDAWVSGINTAGAKVLREEG